MKIALLGYGKMGKAVEAEALRHGHTVVATIDNPDEWAAKQHLLRGCDVAIEFSTPATAVENILRCFDAGLPVVVGTTGWYDQMERVEQACRECGGGLFVASNFSIGMNIMFELNRRLAELMDCCPGYDVSISETHHVHKLDAPSGTAITLANDIVAELHRKERWTKSEAADASDEGCIPITSYREGEVPGIHEVAYESDEDTLTLRHSAKSRRGLAAGAVAAAEYLATHGGICTMRDLLGGGKACSR